MGIRISGEPIFAESALRKHHIIRLLLLLLTSSAVAGQTAPTKAPPREVGQSKPADKKVIDFKVTLRTTVAGNTTPSVVLIKNARLRQEGEGIITLFQCDLARMLRFSEKHKTYRIIPLNDDAPVPAGESSPAAGHSRSPRTGRSGGTVMLTTNILDTGLRNQLLGYSARNFTTETVAEVTPNSCSSARNIKVSTTGWYVDLPGVDLSCADATRASLRLRPLDADCSDRILFYSKGAALSGFPLVLNTTMATSQGEVTMKQEAIDLKPSSLDAALFDVPAGYRRVDSEAELTKPAAASPTATDPATSLPPPRPARSTRTGEPRKPLVRVGLVKMDSADADRIRLQVAHSLNVVELESVPLDAVGTAPQVQVDAEGRKKGVQYLLYIEMLPPEAKTSGATNYPQANVSEKATTAPGMLPMTFSYKLRAVGSSTPLLEATTHPEAADALESSGEQVAREVVSVIRQDKEHRDPQ